MYKFDESTRSVNPRNNLSRWAAAVRQRMVRLSKQLNNFRVRGSSERNNATTAWWFECIETIGLIELMVALFILIFHLTNFDVCCYHLTHVWLYIKLYYEDDNYQIWQNSSDWTTHIIFIGWFVVPMHKVVKSHVPFF